MIDTIGYCGYSSLRGKKSLSFFANQPIIGPNNTRYASQRCAPSGLLFCGVVNA